MPVENTLQSYKHEKEILIVEIVNVNIESPAII